MSVEEDHRENRCRELAGHEAAFGTLSVRHRASALTFSRRIPDANEAEDAVQEAFLVPFLGFKALRDRRSGNWLLHSSKAAAVERVYSSRSSYCRPRASALKEGLTDSKTHQALAGNAHLFSSGGEQRR
jgi:hypothetical protein